MALLHAAQPVPEKRRMNILHRRPRASAGKDPGHDCDPPQCEKTLSLRYLRVLSVQPVQRGISFLESRAWRLRRVEGKLGALSSVGKLFRVGAVTRSTTTWCASQPNARNVAVLKALTAERLHMLGVNDVEVEVPATDAELTQYYVSELDIRLVPRWLAYMLERCWTALAAVTGR